MFQTTLIVWYEKKLYIVSCQNLSYKYIYGCENCLSESKRLVTVTCLTDDMK